MSGHDGLWRARDGHTLILEVKTTDAYRISLDTVARYRDLLEEEGDLAPDHSTILIAVGRQDTGDLEAQIRGSRHAWDVRLVSIEALLRLAAVKEQVGDWRISNQINQVLRPLEYTRVDGIVDLLFETSQDIEEADDDAIPAEIESRPEPDLPVVRGPQANHEPAKAEVLSRFCEKSSLTLVRKGRALRTSSDGNTNVVCLASKAHDNAEGTIYWYGFTPAHREFLLEVDEGFVVFVFSDSQTGIAIPRDYVLETTPDLYTTPQDTTSIDDVKHWHCYFLVRDGEVYWRTKASDELISMSQYTV